MIDSSIAVPSANGVLRFENLLLIHTVKIIIALIKFADMVQAEPAIFAGTVIIVARAINRWRAKFAIFLTSLDRAGPSFAFYTAVKTVRFFLLRIRGRQKIVRSISR